MHIVRLYMSIVYRYAYFCPRMGVAKYVFHSQRPYLGNFPELRVPREAGSLAGSLQSLAGSWRAPLKVNNRVAVLVQTSQAQ